ncbi:MAG: inositol monophosphatase [Elusimicrobia bacterium]|nr:inositol monophosphatase [Elusimicrobiota bacterium]
MSAPAFRRTLVTALKAAGAQLKRGLGRVSFSSKGSGRANVVTPVDYAAERMILDEIGRRFPRHDFLAEERGGRSTGSDYLWVIDPLDGTLNFAHGLPLSCVSIGLVERGRAILGGVYDPFRGELFLAEAGRGASLNGRRMAVSRVQRLSGALLVTGFPYDRDKRAALYAGIARDFLRLAQDLRRSGSAALDLAWVAAGRFDGFWEFRLSPWDVAAGRLLVEEAGGRVSDFSGRPWGSDPSVWGRQTLASNGRVQAAMVGVLKTRAGR